MLGYTEKDLNNMIHQINIAYEIIDGPEEVEKGLEMAIDFLLGLLAEGRI